MKSPWIWTVQGSLTLVGLVGVTALFLPFTGGVSPAQATFGFFWVAASPAFLAVFVSTAWIRWIVAGRLARWEQALGYGLSAGSAGLTILCCRQFLDFPRATWPRLLMVVPPALALALGVMVVVRNWRMKRTRALNPVLAMQVAYVAHALPNLVDWYPNWEIGAYAVLVVVLTYLLQVGLIATQPRGPGNGTAPTIRGAFGVE